MKRLKLIKNEFFDIYVYPLVLTLISLVWFVILCIAFNYMPMEKIEQSFSAFVFAMEMIIFLCIILTCFKFLFTITKGINLYKLADIKKGEVLATQTLIVLFIALIMGYICCFEVTVLEKLLSNKFNIDFSEAPFGMGFLGKPAVSWLYPFTIMFFAWMCYSTVLIIAPIIKIIDNTYIKWVTTFVLIICLAMFQSKFASIVGGMAGDLDFNIYIENGIKKAYFPTTWMAYYNTNFVSDGIAFVSINFLNIGVLLWELAYTIIAYVFNYADLHFRNNRILSGISLAILIVFIASHLIVLDFSNKYDDDIYELYLENGKKTDITKVIDYESDKKIKPAEFFNENFRDKLGNYKICIGKSYEYEDDQGNTKFDYESKFTDNIYSEEIVFEPYLRDFTISLYSKYTMQHLFSVNVRILHEEDKIDDDIQIIINSEKINNLLKI